MNDRISVFPKTFPAFDIVFRVYLATSDLLNHVTKLLLPCSVYSWISTNSNSIEHTIPKEIVSFSRDVYAHNETSRPRGHS